MVSMSFQLPEEGEVLIKKGQLVDFNTPLIKGARRKLIEIPIAKELNIEPTKIFQVLKKLVGDQIVKGDLLAETHGIISMHKYISDIDGKIIKIDYNKGSILIEPSTATTPDDDIIETAFFIGEVKELVKRRVTIEVKDYIDFLIKDASHNFGGQLHRYSNRATQVDIDEVANKVVCLPVNSAFEVVKLEVLGASGVILQKMISPNSNLPSAIMSNDIDWQKIHKTSLPYVIVSKLEQKIYLYDY